MKIYRIPINELRQTVALFLVKQLIMKKKLLIPFCLTFLSFVGVLNA